MFVITCGVIHFLILDVNECASWPCVNGGTCIDRVAKYTCYCPSGYTGDDCETSECKFFSVVLIESCVIILVDIDECESFPCQNGGTCTDSIAGYRCDCIPGHTGEDCETSSPICLSLFV